MQGVHPAGVQGAAAGQAQQCHHPKRLAAWVAGRRLGAAVLLALKGGGKETEGDLWK